MPPRKRQRQGPKVTTIPREPLDGDLAEYRSDSQTWRPQDESSSDDEGAEGVMDDDFKEERQKEHEKHAQIVKQYSSEQYDRYTTYRQATLKKHVKAIMRKSIPRKPAKDGKDSDQLKYNVTESMILIVSAAAKVYAAELVETALDVQREWGELTPGGQAHHSTLQPKHIHEAYRRLGKQSFGRARAEFSKTPS